MKRVKRGAWKRWFAAAAALTWTAFGLVWAQVILLPNPVLPPQLFAELLGDVPPSTHPQRFVVMIIKETSLLLCAFALAGLTLATLARHAGTRWSALVAAVLCAATVAVSLVPVAQAWRIASAEGVPLSLSAYFAGFDSVAERPSETATYARPDGEELKLDVWKPPGGDGGSFDRNSSGRDTQARPAVVVVHGGGWHAGSRSEFPRWNAWLADKGYVVFDIDYRLSPPARWQDAPEDVRCAIGWVKENSARYDVDPERVALMGRSAGGQLALLTAYTESASTLSKGCEAGKGRDTGVAAVVAFYPPTDLARLSSFGYLGGMEPFLGGTQDAVPQHYRLSSPISRLGPGDPPTFLAHGGDDQIVPPGQSELLANRLREVGVTERFVELPWANHTFDFFWGGWGSQITRSTLQEFLEVHLETASGARDDLSRPLPER